jgi:hypothetical protein
MGLYLVERISRLLVLVCDRPVPSVSAQSCSRLGGP